MTARSGGHAGNGQVRPFHGAQSNVWVGVLIGQAERRVATADVPGRRVRYEGARRALLSYRAREQARGGARPGANATGGQRDRGRPCAPRPEYWAPQGYRSISRFCLFREGGRLPRSARVGAPTVSGSHLLRPPQSCPRSRALAPSRVPRTGGGPVLVRARWAGS